MNTKNARTIASWIWSHISAAVALGLILTALLIGYRIGSPAPTQELDHASNAHSEHEPTAPQFYTCSMHPTVRLEDPDAKCPICFMGLIPVMDSSDGNANQSQLVLSESAKAMSSIETTRVGRFFPTARVRLFGKIGYDETSVARLSAYFPGRIDRLFVNYIGVSVQKGDHLAEIYSPDLLAAFEELRQASLSYRNADGASEFLRSTASQTLAAVREKLRLFGLTQQQISDIETGAFEADELTIYAPIGGVVTHLAAREGDYLQTGDPIATVADLSRLWLDLAAYESQLPMLRWGLSVTFTVEAHPGEIFTGRISFIEPLINMRTRTAAVRVAVDNSDGRLKPGMFASAIALPKVAADGAVVSDELAGRWISPMHPTIVKDEPGTCDICGMDLVRAESLGVVGDPAAVQTPLVIPRSAVLFTGTQSIVYVQIKNTDKPTYEARSIMLGPLAGAFYTVRSGLDEGEDVVVNGAFRIDSAMQILAKPSMMMPGTEEHANERASADSSPFSHRLAPVYNAYLDVQESLADDNLDGFLVAAIALKVQTQSINQAGLMGESLGIWRRVSILLVPADPTATIDEARVVFEDMSKGIIDLQKHFGNAGDETLHIAYCPMAFDFKGAKWLQRNTTINNPYFGASMLQCGEIQETFEPLDDPVNEPAKSTHGGHNHD